VLEVTADLGKDQARTGDAAPRLRGGAHAAAKTGRFRRKSVSVPAPLPVPSLTWSPEPVTVPLPVVGAAASAAPQATAVGPGLARRGAAAARSAGASLCALAIVATAVPLAVIQIPDAIAWSLPSRVAAGGPAAVASLLRASGLALPAMAVAGSLAALAVRWLRAGPVLLAGLLLLAAADALGDNARTIALIGADRSLHGAGAGIAMTGLVAVVAERQAQRRQRHEPRAGRLAGRRLVLARRRLVLAGWWAAFTVAGLAVAPGLMRRQVSPGDWHAALRPYPWLTGVALALGALYALLAEGTAGTRTRNAWPAAERAQLALLTAPVAGICAIAMAVTYRGGQAAAAAAVADAIALAGIAAITARAGSAGRFAVVCAVTGFALAPSASAVAALTAPVESTPESGGAVLAAALGGAAVALLTRRPHARAMTAIGLLLAAAGLAALDLAGLAAPSGRLLTLLYVPLAAGLAVALTASLRAAGPAGALAGLVILLAGLVAGYLAAGTVQLRALSGATTVPAAHAALATAAGHWALIAAAVAGTVALALACTGSRRKGSSAR